MNCRRPDFNPSDAMGGVRDVVQPTDRDVPIGLSPTPAQPRAMFTHTRTERPSLQQPLSFVGIGEGEKSLARLLWQLIAPHVDRIIDEFYAKVHEAQIMPSVNQRIVERLKVRQAEHWAALFGSAFDERYANSVRRIGIRHRDIALDPLWYVAGYMTMKIEMVNVIVATDLSPHEKGRMIKTLDKYIAIDMGLALSTYSASIVD
jgi:truncated hemoglobin YjbI